MHISAHDILDNNRTRDALARYPFILLGLLGGLVVTFQLFIQRGMTGIVLLLLLLTLNVFGLMSCLSYLCRNGSGKTVRLFLSAFLILVLLLGEFGSSTESSITFFVNIWKLLILVLLCIVARIDSNRNFASLQLVVSSPITALFVMTICSVLLTVILQLVAVDPSVKGCVRALTFYGALLMALYCIVGLLRKRADFSCARTVFRCVLIVLVGFAVFEMATGFHLPTSWLNGDDPTALIKQSQIAGKGIWITATGPCYNQNDFCLILAVLGCLSLPTEEESRVRTILALVLVAFDLTLMASLGSTITSMGMLVAVAVWGFMFGWCFWCKVIWMSFTVACVFFAPDLYFSLIGIIAEAIQGSPSALTNHVAGSTTVVGDFAVQGSTYEQGYGSMWMRLTLYQQLLSSIMENPLGIGPDSIQAYLSVNPTVSGLVDPHNWWFEFALEYGWVPTCLYILFNTLLVFNLLRCRRVWNGYSLSLCAALCAMYIGSIAPSSSDFNVLLWVPALLACAFLLSSEVRRDQQTALTASVK